ncbi:thymidylate kinase [bacterium BMS3Abin07]|nr:thymidylate kinase [bacterium BMS3Abin07]GBE32499.1 thymidylate kinase [bacterium BMS3Bbin05]HDL20939.1 dTMP kinase [Nitrospirota bacterium]HDO22459.1 dTMP kinase [Nitrospirota bacterium]HDZ88206.1 dTMP kinase [Nitrospirota bacterium]
MRIKKGIFITFEGIEGSGKSTQTGLFCKLLEREGVDFVKTAEPGGTPIGEKIRNILLSVEHTHMTSKTELLLYAASRAQHVEKVIRPALEKGQVVVCDRFSDSTLAYQGYGRGINRDLIMRLNNVCTDGIMPDLTFLLDMDVEAGLARNRSANKVDRLELEGVEFHRKVREGYLAIAGDDSGRVRLIDSSGGIEEVSSVIKDEFMNFLMTGNYVV